MKKFVRKLQKDGTHSYTINIPKELVEEFKWKEWQKLEIFKYFYAIAYFYVISADARESSPSAIGKSRLVPIRYIATF